ncbi:hypothetical protein G6F56_007717 [Rhizopus delemar]|nr:hypothetical protein G6F56_007717 [Rhizopus delemar]
MRTFANASILLNGGSICIQTYIQKHNIFYDNPYKPEDSFVESEEDVTPFKELMKYVTEELKKQSTLVEDIFPKKMDVFYVFVDRVFEDVVAEFVAHLLGKAIQMSSHLYLKTMSIVLESSRQVIDVLTSDEEVAQKIEKDRGVNLLFKLFLPFLDDYLYEESQYAEKVTREQIEDWNNRSSVNLDASARLTNQSRETFKSAATTIASPFHRSSSNVNKRSSTQSTLSTAPSISSSISENKDATVQLESARQELDVLQDYISLETSLQIIKINKESERRVEQFIHIGFPGRMKADIQKTYEQIFTQLLKILSTTHIEPGFESATAQLSTFKPNPYSLSEDVPPLTELFELVHVADVIQQMIQLYYDEEITKHIDKLDFMNDVNKEKKMFERLLDDCVAQSMDRGIQVLLSQIEFILTHEQTRDDYNPNPNALPELKPTKACEDTIQCLKTNTSILAGAAEKGTMDLFFSEICKRFFEVLCKHLKSQTVNEQGGFRYISDMNAYYDFISSLRQKDITTCFLALKSLANIYIIESASDIKLLIHDLERYHGLMRVEDLFEFAACRSDWPLIKRVVQKDMTDCSIM